jgi:hypothetical protein
LRVNLGAVFRDLFKGEEGGITITIKASKDGLLELFYKSARYADGWRYCSYCQCFYQDKCLTHGIKLRNSPRKKKRK